MATLSDRYIWRAALLWLLFALSACTQVHFSDKVAQVKPGQTIESVRALLGTPTNIIESTSNSTANSDTPLKGTVLIYQKPEGDAQIVFINDKVFTSRYAPALNQK